MCFSLLYSRFVFQDGEVTDDKYQDDIGALEARKQILQEVLSGSERVFGLQQLQSKTCRVPGLQGRTKMRLQASKKPDSAFCSGLKQRKAPGFRLHGNNFRAPNTPTTSFLPFVSKLLAGLKLFNIAVERWNQDWMNCKVQTGTQTRVP